MLAGDSPRPPSFDLASHLHDHHKSDCVSPNVRSKMASPHTAASSPTTHDCEHAGSTTTPALTAPSSKSSLAYILTGDHASDDEMDESHAHAYDQQQHQQLNLQPPIVQQQHHYHREQQQQHYQLERHSFHQEPSFVTESYSDRAQYPPPSLSTYHDYHYPQQQQQQSYAAPAPVQRVPRASFPLESQSEPPLKQFSADAASLTQARKKGSKFCMVPGCSSRAKHARLCWKHGGSVKCKVPTCSNRAKSKGVCWSHGGGTICSFDDCSTISVSNGVCWAHGGGKRCVIEGCGRPSYERTGKLCSIHYADSLT